MREPRRGRFGVATFGRIAVKLVVKILGLGSYGLGDPFVELYLGHGEHAR